MPSATLASQMIMADAGGHIGEEEFTGFLFALAFEDGGPLAVESLLRPGEEGAQTGLWPAGGSI